MLLTKTLEYNIEGRLLQFHYIVKIDGEEKLNVVNNNPRTFNNVKVFSRDNWVEPADAEYKNLCIENFDLYDENSGNLIIYNAYTKYTIHSFFLKDALKR